MEMLELECPKCKVLLELDVGFAGGVCRCSDCYILMTVPENPNAERPEKLFRPELPTLGPDSTEEPQPPRDQASDTLEPQQDKAAETYTTASGKRIRIESDTIIPTAHKKKRPAVRATVVLIFMAVVALIFAMCLLALRVLITGEGEGIYTPPVPEAVVVYNPSANPFLLDHPNLLGLPITGRCTLIIDASEHSQPWLGVVKRAIQDGMSHPSSKVSLLVVMTSNGEIEVSATEHETLEDLKSADLGRFLRGNTAFGDADLPAAVDRAMQGQPDRLVIITGNEPTQAQSNTLARMFDASPQVQVDVAQIDGAATSSWSGLCRPHGGQAVAISLQQLRQWQDATF